MPEASRNRPVNLLLIEDNEADILLLREALEEIDCKIDLHVICDGEDALRYLRCLPPHEKASRPDLVLLDMNLPKKNGFEILAELKQDDHLKLIPVIILSTSRAAMDINRSYRLHANCFVSKSGTLNEYIDRIRSILSFWMTTASLPGEETP